VQLFPVITSYQFAILDPKEVADGDTVAVNSIILSEDWFYPFSKKSNAIGPVLMSGLALVGTIFALVV